MLKSLKSPENGPRPEVFRRLPSSSGDLISTFSLKYISEKLTYDATFLSKNDFNL
jgi:hypothetical protein